jgi:sortase A
VTSFRPEHDPYGAPREGGHEYGYGYGAEDGLGAAVDGLADPLSDPLPGRQPSGWAQEPTGPYDPHAGREGGVQPQQYQEPPQYRQYQEPQEWYDPEGYRRDWYGQQTAYAPDQQTPVTGRQTSVADQQTWVPGRQVPEPQPEPRYGGPVDEATVALHTVPPHTASPHTASGQSVSDRPVFPQHAPQHFPEQAFAPRPRTVAPEPEAVSVQTSGAGDAQGPGAGAHEGGGRAQRRRAARGGSPAKAGKDSTGVVVSRFVGELFITFGVVMLLFVTYQLWWTNVRAGMQADGAAHSLQSDWANGGSKPKAAGVFEPGQGFAIMHIPKLDVKVPVAEGIDKHKVLDRGMVGHYAEGKLKTAMPSDKQGNFAVAGHRNTHGEPFRYVNRLVKGDKIVVETRDAFYTYEMTSMLPQTSPSNVGVIQPVPPGSGFSKPGRYLTLTTCTPEFTSTYRLIVWGKMVDERPRSKGMPAALDG